MIKCCGNCCLVGWRGALRQYTVCMRGMPHCCTPSVFVPLVLLLSDVKDRSCCCCVALGRSHTSIPIQWKRGYGNQCHDFVACSLREHAQPNSFSCLCRYPAMRGSPAWLAGQETACRSTCLDVSCPGSKIDASHLPAVIRERAAMAFGHSPKPLNTSSRVCFER